MNGDLNFPFMREAVLKLLPLRGPASGRERANKFMDEGVFVTPAFGTVPYDAGAVWNDVTKRTRSRYFHGFLFFGDWHSTVLADPLTARRYASAAVRLVEEWDKQFGRESEIPATSHHDETTAQRLIQLTCLSLSIASLVSEEDFALVNRVSLETATLLATDEFYAGANNHGMFQDLALMYYSVVIETPSMQSRLHLFSKANDRLYSYFSTAFATDGVHIENTPTYHLMVSRHLHGVLSILKPGNHEFVQDYSRLLEKAAEYATHALKPNGMYPPISDTTEQLEANAGRQNIFGSEQFAYAATAGKIGSVPDKRTLVLPESGYAIYRSSWTNPRATFVFFSAAYNADYHKHSDELSLFVRTAGVDLLSEAGAYGYDYKEPLTKYAYSSFAHNGLIVDGKSLPRTDKLSHRTTLTCNEYRPDGFSVTGQTSRFEGVEHSRTVEISEIDEKTHIELRDEIVSAEIHTYDLLWNIGQDVDVVLHGQGFELFHHGKKLLDLHFEADVSTATSLHRGETKPQHLGWRFPKFGQSLPAPVVRIRMEAKTASIKTTIRTKDFFYADRGLNVSANQWQRSNTARNLNFLPVPAKTDQGRSKLVVVFTAIHAVGDFTFNYKQSLDAVDVNALYILDDHGDQGSYYLSDHGDTAIFKSVQELIGAELDRLGLSKDDLITAGSSKGGAAAILHGAAFGAGNIIVGAPQTKIGSFLQRPHPNILKFITGSESDEAVTQLDAVIFDCVQSMNSETRLSIIVGEKDHHFRNHVKPLQEHALAHNKNLQVTVLPGLPHAEIGKVYKSFLVDNVAAIVSSSAPVLGHEDFVDLRVNSGILNVAVSARPGFEIAFRLFRERELVRTVPYGERTSFSFGTVTAGRYRVRVFYRDLKTQAISAFTSVWTETP